MRMCTASSCSNLGFFMGQNLEGTQAADEEVSEEEEEDDDEEEDELEEEVTSAESDESDEEETRGAQGSHEGDRRGQLEWDNSTLPY